MSSVAVIFNGGTFPKKKRMIAFKFLVIAFIMMVLRRRLGQWLDRSRRQKL
jgi:hypothetical protein